MVELADSGPVLDIQSSSKKEILLVATTFCQSIYNEEVSVAIRESAWIQCV